MARPKLTSLPLRQLPNPEKREMRGDLRTIGAYVEQERAAGFLSVGASERAACFLSTATERVERETGELEGDERDVLKNDFFRTGS